MIRLLSDKELLQGWATLPLVYGGGAATGPLTVRLTRPGGRQAFLLTSDWMESGFNALTMVNGCLPKDMPADTWIEQLTVHAYNKVVEASFQLLWGRAAAVAFEKANINARENPALTKERLTSAVKEAQADPLVCISQLSLQQSDYGAVDIPLLYYLGHPPAGYPERVHLTLPLGIEKADLALAYQRRGPFYPIEACLPAELPAADLLDALTVESIYRLLYAAMELSFGRESLQRLAADYINGSDGNRIIAF